jgi:hypothetical protein
MAQTIMGENIGEVPLSKPVSKQIQICTSLKFFDSIVFFFYFSSCLDVTLILIHLVSFPVVRIFCDFKRYVGEKRNAIIRPRKNRAGGKGGVWRADLQA